MVPGTWNNQGLTVLHFDIMALADIKMIGLANYGRS